jgi:hypothetical protein
MLVGPHDKLTDSKNTYQIKVFRTVQINITTSEGNAYIELKNVALVTGYMTNLVSLYLLN